jgi:N-acetylneuraminic acid mutarotase
VLAVGALAPAEAAGWRTTRPLVGSRVGQATALLPDGKVLVAGGYDGSVLATAEVFDPAAGAWQPTGSLLQPRNGGTAVVLPTGKVLVAGGSDGVAFLDTAELYDPQTGTWSAAAPMMVARDGHNLTVLADGRVLASGGRDNSSSLPLATEVYDPAAGAWLATPGSLAVGHLDATATRLADGRVLVAGGSSESVGIAVAEIFDPATGQWSATGSMTTGRTRHSATLLRDGTVLAAGGFGSAYLTSSETYDPVAGTWSLTSGTLAKARSKQAAVLLPNGKVLVAGGFNATDGALALTEAFDPATRTWSAAGSLATARYGASGVLLPGGRVLLATGATGSSYTATAEIYDPAVPSWSAAGSMAEGRSSSAATLLADGRVLVAGGVKSTTPGDTASAAVDLYDPVSRTWTDAAPLNVKRTGPTGTMLVDGRVLVAGGFLSSFISTSSAEIFDPTTETWTLTGAMATGHYYHSATLLADGRVLVAGGYNLLQPTAELYDPKAGVWSSAGQMTVERWHHTATLLSDGRVLMVGGRSGMLSTQTAEIYDPATGAWAATGSLARGRQGHTATLLANGTVLVAGGWDGGWPLASVEIFDPATGTWSAAPPLSRARFEPQDTLLPDGRVLITGGGNDVDGYLLTTEIYDPASRTWASSGSLAQGRGYHSATLLTSGEVLIAGGSGPEGFVASAEVFDPGYAYAADARPVVDPVIAPLLEGNALGLTGTGLRARSEASGGNGSQNAAVDGPRVQLRRLDSGLVRWVAPDPAAAPWSDTAFSSAPLVGLQPGPVVLTVFASGVPSTSTFVTAECAAPVVETQPSSLTVNANDPADFSVAAVGAGLSYRWRHNGVPIAESAEFVGTGAASLRLPRARLPQAGAYDVVVSSACSSEVAVSTAATLEILPATSLSVVVSAVENGRGQVSVDPAAAICGDASVTGPDVTCTYPFASGDTVTLTATAGADSAFDGWTGACTGLSPTCVVTQDNVITTRATFRGPQTLHVDVVSLFQGSGSVVVMPGPGACAGTPGASTPCEFQYPPRSVLTLSAEPAPGSAFVRWRGACTGVGSCVVALSDNATVAADFEVPNQLPIAVAGPDQTVEAGTPVLLDGSGSSDPDGGQLTYSWTNATGSIVGNSATVNVSVPSGAHTFTLKVTDNRGGFATDPVVVTGLDTTPPAVALDLADGAQLLVGTQIVQWTATDAGGLGGFDLLLSGDGHPFEAIPGCTNLAPTARQCTFLIPTTIDPAFLRIVARDLGGTTSSDDATVAIVPAITVTAPNTAVQWAVGSTQTITWTSRVGGAVYIELSRNGGTSWTVLGSASATAGSVNWTVSGATTTTARIRVRPTSNSSYADSSDVNFSIVTPFVTVTSPNTPAPWLIGTLRPIAWMHNLGASATFSVEVSRNNGATWTVIQTGVPSASPSTGFLTWTVTGPPANAARIRVRWTTNTAILGQSLSFPIF